MKKCSKIFFLFYVLFNSTSPAQDACFTQHQRSLLHSNPAFAGSSGRLRIQSSTQYLWPGIGGYLNSYIGSDFALSRGGGMGFSWTRQANNASLNRNSFGLAYSKRIAFKKKKIILQPAFATHYSFIKTEWDKMKFQTEIDSIQGFVNPSYEYSGIHLKSNMDISAGLLVFMKNWYTGFSCIHITQPDEGFIGPNSLSMRLGIQAGYQTSITKNLLINSSFQSQRQGDWRTLSFSSSVIYKKLAAGLAWSTNKSVSINLGWQNEKFRAAVSHSIFYSGIPYSTTYGSYEVSLSMNILTPREHTVFFDPKGF